MKIRINQDVTFNWKLTVEDESVDLSKLELSVEITTPSNKKVEITPNIQFDTLEFNYRPKQVGTYIASVYLNRFKDGETALDVKAFEGVKYSWNQDLSNDDNLVANSIELTGNLNYGPKLDTCLNITYTEIVNLRNNSKLTSGRFYRITDYITTTTQANTKSAEHPFDVIVLALSESELSEQAWAIQSARDTDGHFASSKLGAWQIWYSLDNDKTRFAWASSSKGRGVIYRMIDEYNNDCPYDFKNISILNEMGGDDYLYAIGDDRDMSSSGVFFNNKIYPSFTGKFRLKAVSITHHGLTSLVHNTVIAPNCDHVVAAGPNIKIGHASKYLWISGNSIRVGAGCRDIFLYQAEYTRIGDNCNSINVGGNRPASENYYLQNVVFDNSVISINITSPQTASSQARIQNIRVSTGYYSGIDIIVNRELLYETAVAIDSAGNVKQFCIADIIQ